MQALSALLPLALGELEAAPNFDLAEETVEAATAAARELLQAAEDYDFETSEPAAGLLEELRGYRSALEALEEAAEESRAGGFNLERLLSRGREAAEEAEAFVRRVGTGRAIVAAEEYGLPPEALEEVCENLSPPLEALHQAAALAAERARRQGRLEGEARLRPALEEESAAVAAWEARAYNAEAAAERERGWRRSEREATAAKTAELREALERAETEAESLRVALGESNGEAYQTGGRLSELEAALRGEEAARRRAEERATDTERLLEAAMREAAGYRSAAAELRSSAEESERALEEARANERRWRANHEAGLAARAARSARAWEELNNDAPGGRDGEAWELAAEELAGAFESYRGNAEHSPEEAAEALRQAALRLAPRLSELYAEVWPGELYTSPGRAARLYATNWLSEAAAALGELATQAAFGDLAG